MSGQEKTACENKGPEKGSSLLRRVLGFTMRGLGIFFLLFVLACLAGGYWLCNTASGHDFLLYAGNRFLGAPEPNGKIRVHFRKLEGSLPFSFSVAFDLYDDSGVFLQAPDNRVSFDWRDLPGRINLQTLSLVNPALLRLPSLPPQPGHLQAEKPLTLADIKSMAAGAARYISEQPDWFPAVQADGLSLVNATFPAHILGESPETPAGEKGDNKGVMLRANSRISLNWDKKGLSGNARLCLDADKGKTVSLPGFSFAMADLNLKINASAQKGMLLLNAALQASLDKPQIEIEKMPPDLAGEKIGLKFSADLQASCPDYSTLQTAEITVSGPDIDAGRISGRGEGSWFGGQLLADNKIGGSLKYGFHLALANGGGGGEDILAVLRTPLSASILASGDISRPDLSLSLNCEDIAAAGHTLKNFSLLLAGNDLALPGGLQDIEKDENQIRLSVSGILDGHGVACETGLFYRAEKTAAGAGTTDFLAGMRDFNLLAAGIEGKGELAASIRAGQKPALDGSFSFRVKDWAALAALLPASAMAGEAHADFALASGENGQKAAAKIDVPRFSLNRGKERLVSLRGFGMEADISDAFVSPVIDGRLHLESMQAAGMRLGGSAAVKGPLAGPLQASLESNGSVASKIRLAWKPGSVEAESFYAEYSIPAKGRGGAVRLGAKAARPVRISYGENGLDLGSIDLAILPAGRLKAAGLLSPQKLDLALNVENLAFSPWQSLIPQLPVGTAGISLRLQGTPQRPLGSFRLDLAGVKASAVPLAPANLAVLGQISPQGNSRGVLNVHLDLPQDTLKSLGGSLCDARAKIPLLFGRDGIPSLDMGAPFSAHAVWDGMLAPLWNLAPVADMRLNGKIGVNITASGSMARPRIKGDISIGNGRYENLALGVLLAAISMKLDLEDVGLPAKGSLPGSLRLALTASDGRGGSIDVSGGGMLSGSNLDIEAKINRLRPLRRRDIHVELSGGAKISGSALAPLIAGKIVVNKGEVLLDSIDMGAGGITTLPITVQPAGKAPAGKALAGKALAGEDAAKAASTEKGGGRLDVRIIVPPRFSVEGRGLTSLWEASLLLSGPLADPVLTGDVSCYRGTFDFLGKDFVLTRGKVLFAGGSISRPLLDIELTNETPELTAHLFITGPANKMKLSLGSEPELPRDDILSKVLFGRSSNELSRLEALQLAAAAAQLAGFTGNGSSIFQMGKKAFGLDVLRLGSSSGGKAGEPGQTTASGATLETGKYINDWLYMGVEQGMKADSTAFVIELQLTPRSAIEVHTEQSDTWAGYKWKMNY